MSRPPAVEDGRLRCGNASRGGLLAHELLRLDRRGSRFRQAAFRRLGEGQALWLEPALAVHSFFAAGPLRAVFVDAGLHVLAVERLPRFRALPAPTGAAAALIQPDGTGEAPRAGDRLELLRTQPRDPERVAGLS
jgi:hypothetical protein